MGLRRALRLTRTVDYDRLRHEGKTLRSRWFLMNTARNTLDHNRYGIITGRRVGGAVIRNRARRRLQEVIHMRDPGLESGWDVVLVVHASAAQQPLTELLRTFDTLARQAGIVQE